MTAYPFLYFGHAYSEDAIVDVTVWFKREPAKVERESISKQLAACHSFWHTIQPESLVWSATVIRHQEVLDRERKHLTPTEPTIASALKRADYKLYGIAKGATRAVPFALHLLVDQALADIHTRVPIAFAVRETGARDKTTEWHRFSIANRGAALQHIQELLEKSPPTSTSLEHTAQVAPWLLAAANVIRFCATKESLAAFSDIDKGVLGDLCLLIADRAQPDEGLDPDSSSRDEIAENRDALLALAQKLRGGRSKGDQATSPREALDNILLEARQFEFTRIKMSECPTFESAKNEKTLRFEIAIDATERLLRKLEDLSGNKPGATGLTFGVDDQQFMQVLEKTITGMLRAKGNFSEDAAVRMLKTLATSIRPIRGWVPIEAICKRLTEHANANRTKAFDVALNQLLAHKHALAKGDEARPLFEAMRQGRRTSKAPA